MTANERAERVEKRAWELHHQHGHPLGYDGPCWGPTVSEQQEAQREIEMPLHGTVRPHDPTLFSLGSAGGSGYCWLASRRPGGCRRPVVDVWRTKVRDRSGRPGGGWWALCSEHATGAGIDVPEPPTVA